MKKHWQTYYGTNAYLVSGALINQKKIISAIENNIYETREGFIKIIFDSQF